MSYTFFVIVPDTNEQEAVHLDCQRNHQHQRRHVVYRILIVTITLVWMLPDGTIEPYYHPSTQRLSYYYFIFHAHLITSYHIVDCPQKMIALVQMDVIGHCHDRTGLFA